MDFFDQPPDDAFLDNQLPEGGQQYNFDDFTQMPNEHFNNLGNYDFGDNLALQQQSISPIDNSVAAATPEQPLDTRFDFGVAHRHDFDFDFSDANSFNDATQVVPQTPVQDFIGTYEPEQDAYQHDNGFAGTASTPSPPENTPHHANHLNFNSNVFPNTPADFLNDGFFTDDQAFFSRMAPSRIPEQQACDMQSNGIAEPQMSAYPNGMPRPMPRRQQTTQRATSPSPMSRSMLASRPKPQSTLSNQQHRSSAASSSSAPRGQLEGQQVPLFPAPQQQKASALQTPPRPQPESAIRPPGPAEYFETMQAALRNPGLPSQQYAPFPKPPTNASGAFIVQNHLQSTLSILQMSNESDQSSSSSRPTTQKKRKRAKMGSLEPLPMLTTRAQAMAEFNKSYASTVPKEPQYRKHDFASLQEAKQYLQRASEEVTYYQLNVAGDNINLLSAENMADVKQHIFSAMKIWSGDLTEDQTDLSDEELKRLNKKHLKRYRLLKNLFKREATRKEISAQIDLLVDAIENVHKLGIPMADLKLKGISAADIASGKLDSNKVITKKSKKVDHELTFANRLLCIQNILKINKWIAIDVAKGRDFIELAAAPRACHKLKLTNNAGNDKKGKRIKLGAKVLKQQAGQDVGDDVEEDGVEEDEDEDEEYEDED